MRGLCESFLTRQIYWLLIVPYFMNQLTFSCKMMIELVWKLTLNMTVVMSIWHEGNHKT